MWCKYSHCGQFQATKVISSVLQIHWKFNSWPSGACRSLSQHATVLRAVTWNRHNDPMTCCCSHFTDGGTKAQKIRYPRSQANRAALSVNQEVQFQSKCSSPPCLQCTMWGPPTGALTRPWPHSILIVWICHWLFGCIQRHWSRAEHRPAYESFHTHPRAPIKNVGTACREQWPWKSHALSKAWVVVRKDQIYQQEV